MPYKSEKIKIVGTKFDRRRKLTEEDKQEIHANKQGLSQRSLAAMYNVSRRLIQFILDPAKQEANLLRRKESGGSKQYYQKDRHTKAIREHRKYKQELLINKQIEL